MFPGERHILDISELTHKNLDDKSVFDYINKKQTIDGWSSKSHYYSIAIFIAKYFDLLYQMPFEVSKQHGINKTMVYIHCPTICSFNKCFERGMQRPKTRLMAREKVVVS